MLVWKCIIIIKKYFKEYTLPSYFDGSSTLTCSFFFSRHGWIEMHILRLQECYIQQSLWITNKINEMYKELWFVSFWICDQSNNGIRHKVENIEDKLSDEELFEIEI